MHKVLVCFWVAFMFSASYSWLFSLKKYSKNFWLSFFPLGCTKLIVSFFKVQVLYYSNLPCSLKCWTQFLSCPLILEELSDFLERLPDLSVKIGF